MISSTKTPELRMFSPFTAMISSSSIIAEIRNYLIKTKRHRLSTQSYNNLHWGDLNAKHTQESDLANDWNKCTVNA